MGVGPRARQQFLLVSPRVSFFLFSFLMQCIKCTENENGYVADERDERSCYCFFDRKIGLYVRARLMYTTTYNVKVPKQLMSHHREL
jgi:hypothetical protein